MDTSTLTTRTLWSSYESPFGIWTLETSPRGITAIGFPGEGHGLTEDRRDPGALAALSSQLDEYFAGERQSFDVEFDLSAHRDPLAGAVWEQLRAIPYGETTTYGELGRRLGHEDPRDIGACVGATPVPIAIPCHRVIGADGALRGYRGGLPVKEALLGLEHRASGNRSTPLWARGEQLGLI